MMITKTAYSKPSYREGQKVFTVLTSDIDTSYKVSDVISVVDTAGSEMARWLVLRVDDKVVESVVSCVWG